MNRVILLVLICLTLPPSLIELDFVEFRIQYARIDQAWWDWSRLTNLSNAMTTTCALSALAHRRLLLTPQRRSLSTVIIVSQDSSEDRLCRLMGICAWWDHKTDALSMPWTTVPLQYNRLCVKTDLLVRTWKWAILVKECTWPTRIQLNQF